MTWTIQQFLISTDLTQARAREQFSLCMGAGNWRFITLSTAPCEFRAGKVYIDHKSNQLKPSVALSITRDALLSKILANFTKTL